MPMFVVSAPSLLTSGHAVGTALSHSSTVRSIQALLGVSPSETDPTTGKPFPWLGHAGDVNTNDLASFFAAGQFP